MEREAAEALVDLSKELEAAATLVGFRTEPVHPDELAELNAYLNGTVPEIYRLPECQGLFDTMFSMTSGFGGGTLKGGNAPATRALLQPKILMEDGMAVETLAFLGEMSVYKDAFTKAMDAQILVAAKVAAATTGTAATLMGFQDLIGFWALCSTTIAKMGPPPESIVAFVAQCFGLTETFLMDNMLFLALGIAVSLYVFFRRDKVSEGKGLLELIVADGARGALLATKVLVGFGNYVVNTKDAFAYLFSETYANWTALISATCASVRQVYSQGKAMYTKFSTEAIASAREENTQSVLREIRDLFAEAKLKWTIEDAKNLEAEVSARETRKKTLAAYRKQFSLATISVDRFVFNFFPRVGIEIAALFGHAYEKIVDTLGPPSMNSTRFTDRFKALLRRNAEINRDQVEELRRLRTENVELRKLVQVKDSEFLIAMDAAFSVLHGEEPRRSRSRSRSPPRRGGPRSRFA
jgi:hypothetical protein